MLRNRNGIRLSRPEARRLDYLRTLSALFTEDLVQGDRVRLVEKVLSQLVGTNYAILTSSCTTALETSLRAVGVGPGDHVLVSAYSWQASANCIEAVGAIPAFVDVDPSTFNTNAELVQSALDLAKSEARLHLIKAMILVHAFGRMSNVQSISKVLTAQNIVLIEDAACALGAIMNNDPAGSVGTVGCFSFHPRKSITSGEGGLLVCNDPLVYRRARLYCNHGRAIEDSGEFESGGSNFRLTDFQAAMLEGQVKRIKRTNNRRRNAAERYCRLLSSQRRITCPKVDGLSSVWQSFAVLIDGSAVGVQNAMRRKGIEVGLGTLPIPFTTYYRRKFGLSNEMFPGLMSIYDKVVTLPLHSRIRFTDQKRVVDALIEALDGQ